MAQVNRLSFGKLRKVEFLPGEMGMRVRARIARDGIQEYTLADGTKRRELRSKETLQATIAQLKDLPVTLGHCSGVITPQSWRTDAVGHVADVDPDLEFDGKHHWAVATLAIQDSQAIASVLAQERSETSLGQLVDVDAFRRSADPLADFDAPVGIPNHVSLELKGFARAGRGCRVLLDSLDENHQQMPAILPEKGITAVTPEELQKLLDGQAVLLAKLEALEASGKAEREGLQAQLDAATSTGATLQAKLDAAPPLETQVTEELAFRESLRHALPADYAFTSRRQARLDSIAHLGGAVKPDASDAYLEAYLAAKLEGRTVAKLDGASKEKTPEEIQQEIIAAYRKAHS